MRTLTYVVGATIDGFIAGPAGEVDFFPVTDDVVAALVADYPETLPAHVRAALGVDPANQRFDTCVMGRGTYEVGLRDGIGNPYPHLRQYVLSRTLPRDTDPGVDIRADDPVALVRELKRESGLGIVLIGGGALARTLREEIDELVVKVYPVAAGSGVALFAGDFAPTRYALTSARPLEGGTVILSYRRP
ncbi:deaminase [Pilimelia terevasa]|uniref:Deaminase n=1 Tax=Pilimelia terevasa TaxID=53372 RepID=A0A8J3FFG3_9ACTN|nr:dihydrofolate reductase family protein [Pilimelia terevasa]GGK18005.1 deaminase [Pilimelia terevasa]